MLLWTKSIAILKLQIKVACNRVTCLVISIIQQHDDSILTDLCKSIRLGMSQKNQMYSN